MVVVAEVKPIYGLAFYFSSIVIHELCTYTPLARLALFSLGFIYIR